MSTILTLLAVSLNDQPLTRPITARFDASGGTIGRTDHNTMSLPDPERFISRKQAEIVLTDEGFVIRNVGAANPIVVGHRTLGQGETAVLRPGDGVRIGGYELRADYPGAASPGQTIASAARSARASDPSGDASAADVHSAATPPNLAPRTAPSATPGGTPGAASGAGSPLQRAAIASSCAQPRSSGDEAGANPFADLLGPAPGSAANPFADLLGAAPATAPAEPTANPASSGADPFQARAAAPCGPPAAPRAAPSVAAPPAVAPARSSIVDPFDGLIPPPAGVQAGSAAFAAPAPTPGRLPDDFDPFGPAEPTPPIPVPALAGSADDPFFDLRAASAAPTLDAAFDLPSATPGDDPLARFMAGVPIAGPGPVTTAGPSAETDPLAALGFTSAGDADAFAAAQPDHLRAVHGAYAPPRVAMPAVEEARIPTISPLAAPLHAFAPAEAPAATPAAAPAASVQADAQAAAPVWAPAVAPEAARASAAPAQAAALAAGADAESLWRAFCDGAGVALALPPGPPTERMRAIGLVLRAAVDGTLQLMSVRASTKNEMRAAVTQIQARGNNPLKFTPDGAGGVEQLVMPPARGFLGGPEAMRDAMADLVGHSIGTVQGMRAALEGMLERFDPAALEAKLGAGSVLDSLLPMNRKARLWELYLQHFRTLRDEAEEDFHALFGKAFVAAYEQQVERLKARDRSS